MSECLIHIQHIQPSDGAKWDVLFLRIIKHAPSIFHPTIMLNWINLSQHTAFFVVRGTTWYRRSTLSLFPSLLILCCLHWGNTDLKACKVSDYLTWLFSAKVPLNFLGLQTKQGSKFSVTSVTQKRSILSFVPRSTCGWAVCDWQD